MAFVAVNKNGSEVIGVDLFRAKEEYDLIESSDKTNGYFWCDAFNDSELNKL